MKTRYAIGLAISSAVISGLLVHGSTPKPSRPLTPLRKSKSLVIKSITHICKAPHRLSRRQADAL